MKTSTISARLLFAFALAVNLLLAGLPRPAAAETTEQITSTMILITTGRSSIAGGTLPTEDWSCPGSYPHLVNWKDNSTGGITYSELDSGGNGTSSNPDWVKIQFGGGISGGEFGIQYICSSVWWPTTWDCGAEGEPNCWGAVQGYAAGTPEQGWMGAGVMVYANGNGLCDEGLIGEKYRCDDE